MAKKLKVFQTSLGFYDEAIAAPSMKTALQARGARSNLFHQGIAKESNDPGVVAAAMSKPGVILRRPVGSDGPFKEHAELPMDLSEVQIGRKPRESRPEAKTPPPGQWTARPRVKPLSHSRRKKDGASASARRKRPLRRRSANAAEWLSRKRKRPWKRPSENMIAERRPLTPSVRPLRRDRKTRTSVGKPKGKNCRSLCAARASRGYDTARATVTDPAPQDGTLF
jgi:colicin import membrane protein